MQVLDGPLVSALTRLDGCTIANAIETFDVRLRNEGFADARVRCVFDERPPVVGHAVTARIRTSAPPPVGHTYYDRTDWWNYIVTVPAPRIVVVEDVDSQIGRGAFLGQVHANVLHALGCVALATNGAVRDVPGVDAIGFQLFAGSIAVSHAYVHIVDFGQPVEIAGLPVAPGDIVFGDRHGLQTIPPEIAAAIPAVAADMIAREREVIGFCQSPEFSIERLRSLIRQLG